MKAFDLKPEWLEYLETIARTRSIRQAAEELYLTEHSLRYNLKLLESFIGEALLEKTAQGLVLNPRGQSLINQSQRFRNRLSQLESQLQLTADNRQELKLAFSQAYPSELLMPIFAQLQQTFPQLQLTAERQKPLDVEKGVLLGQYELGLTTWVPNNLTLPMLSGPKWPGVFVKRTQASVAEYYLLPPAWRYFNQEPIIYPAEVSHFQVRYLGSLDILLKLALAGGGIAYLPLPYVLPAIEAGLLETTLGPNLSFSLGECLLAKDFYTLSPPAAAFVHQLKARWQQHNQLLNSTQTNSQEVSD